jgi:hypothetical protein
LNWRRRDQGAGPQDVAVKAAYESAAAIIVRIAADELDIEPDELLSDLLPIAGKTDLPEIVISDRLPNGAGFAAWIAGQMPRLLRTISDYEHPEHMPDFVKNILLHPRHLDGRERCDRSCYRCLRSYQNRRRHGMLDWRLGLDVLSVMAGASQQSIGWGSSAPWWNAAHFNERLRTTARAVVERHGSDADLRSEVQLIGNRFHAVNVQGTSLVLGHPLWDPGALGVHGAVPPGNYLRRYMDWFTLTTSPTRVWRDRLLLHEARFVSLGGATQRAPAWIERVDHKIRMQLADGSSKKLRWQIGSDVYEGMVMLENGIPFQPIRGVPVPDGSVFTHVWERVDDPQA